MREDTIVNDPYLEVNRIWKSQKLKQLGLWTMFVIGSIVGLIVVTMFCTDKPSESIQATTWSDAFVRRAISAPKDMMNLLLYGALALAFMTGFSNGIRTIVRIILGPPKAGKTAEKSVELFFGSVLIAAGSMNMGKVRADGLYMLAPEAIKQIGGWTGCRSYWDGVNQVIIDRLSQLSTSFSQTRFSTPVSTVNILSEDTCRINCVINFRTIRDQGSNQVSLGSWEFLTDCPLRKIDGRWYLTSAQCTFKHDVQT